MKKNRRVDFATIHWAAKTSMKTGSLAANALLLPAFGIIGKNLILARQMAETSVMLFAVGMIGGMLLDVITKRMGM